MNDRNKDPFRELFSGLKEERAPAGFREEMMRQIRMEELRMRKRNHMWGIIGIVTAVICLAVTLGYVLWGLEWTVDWQAVRMPAFTWSPLFSFLGYILFLSGILLWGDYLFRKYYNKKHKENLE